MAGSGQTIQIRFEAVGNFNNIINNAKTLQGALNKLKLPANIADKFNKDIEQVKQKTQQMQELMNKPNKTKADYSSIQKLSQEIDKLSNKIKTNLNNLDMSKLTKGVAEMPGVKKAQAELDKYVNSVKKAYGSISNFGKAGKVDLTLFSSKNLNNLDQMINKGTRFKQLFTDFRTATMNGDLEKASSLLQQLEAHATRYGSKMKGFGKGDTKGLEAIRAMKTELDKLMPEYNLFADKLNTTRASGLQNVANQVRNIQSAFQGVLPSQQAFLDNNNRMAQNQYSMSQQLGDLKMQANYFFGLQNMFQLLKRGVGDAVDTIKELDKAMTETAVVTDFSVPDMWNMLPEYTKNANELGASIKDVYEAATLYYQQGLDKEQSMGLARETLKMGRIGGLEAKESTDMMTAALRGFNMDINEQSGQRINDVYSELAAITAADTREIGSAMERTASIAHSAGMEFETTSAFLSQMIETTREAPENLGTAMKTIVARFQEMKENPMEIGEVEGEEVNFNRVDKALKSIGVDLVKNKDEFRDLDDVFLEISDKWSGLSQTQQRYIATIAAGSRQQSRFLAMVGNAERLNQLVDAAHNSTGASQIQFEKTLDSLDAKINKFRNQWDQFVMGITNSNLVKGITDFGTKAMSIFNKLMDVVGKLPRPLGAAGKSVLSLGTAFAGLKIGGKVVNSVLGGVGNLIDPKAKGGFLGGAKLGAVGLKQEANAQQAAMISNPIVAAIRQLQGAITGMRDFRNQQQQAGVDRERLQQTTKDVNQIGRKGQEFYYGKVRNKLSDLSTEQQAYVMNNNRGLLHNLQTNLASIPMNSKSMDKDTQNIVATNLRQMTKYAQNNGLKFSDLFSINGAESKKQLYDQLKSGDHEMVQMAENFSNMFSEHYTKASRSAMAELMKSSEAKDFYAQYKEKNKEASRKDAMMATRSYMKEQYYDQYRSSTYAKANADVNEQMGIQNNWGTMSRTLTATERAGQAFSGFSTSLQGIGMAANSAAQGLRAMGLEGMASVVQGVSSAFMGMGSAIQGIGGAISGLGNLKSLLPSLLSGKGIIGMAITGVVVGITTAIASYKKHIKEVRKEADKVAKSFKTQTEAADKNLSTIEQNRDSFKELSEGVDQYGNNVKLGAEEYQDYVKIVDELVTMNPEIIKGFNAEGRAIIDNNTALQEAEKLQREKKKQAAEDFTSEDSLDKLIKGRDTKKTFLRNRGWGAEYYDDGSVKRAATGESRIDKYKKELVKGMSSIGEDNEVSDYLRDTFGISLDNLDELAMKKIDNYGKTITDSLTEKFNPEGDETKTTQIEAVKKTIKDLNKEQRNYDKAIGDIVDSLSTYAAQNHITDQMDPRLQTSFNESLKTIAGSDLTGAEMQDSIDTLGIKFKNLNGHAGEYEEALQKIDDAQKEFKNAGSYFADDRIMEAEETINKIKNSFADDTSLEGKAIKEMLENDIANIEMYPDTGIPELSESFNTLQTQIESANKAYENFTKAIEGGDYYTAIEGLGKIYEEIRDGTDDAGLGSQGFWTGAQSLLGESNVKGKDIKSVKKQLDTVKSFFEQDESGSFEKGAENFVGYIGEKLKNGKVQDSLKQYGEDVQNAITFNEEGGLDWKVSNLDTTQLTQLAESFGMSLDTFVGSLNNLRQFYGLHFDNPDIMARAAQSDEGVRKLGANGEGKDQFAASRSYLESQNNGQEINDKAVTDAGIKIVESLDTYRKQAKDDGKKGEEAINQAAINSWKKDLGVTEKTEEGKPMAAKDYLDQMVGYVPEEEIKEVYQNAVDKGLIKPLEDGQTVEGASQEILEERQENPQITGISDQIGDIGSTTQNLLTELHAIGANLRGEDSTANDKTFVNDFKKGVFGKKGTDTLAQFYAKGLNGDGKKLTDAEYTATRKELNTLLTKGQQKSEELQQKRDNFDKDSQLYKNYDKLLQEQNALNKYLDERIQEGNKVHKKEQDKKEGKEGKEDKGKETGGKETGGKEGKGSKGEKDKEDKEKEEKEKELKAKETHDAWENQSNKPGKSDTGKSDTKSNGAKDFAKEEGAKIKGFWDKLINPPELNKQDSSKGQGQGQGQSQGQGQGQQGRTPSDNEFGKGFNNWLNGNNQQNQQPPASQGDQRRNPHENQMPNIFSIIGKGFKEGLKVEGGATAATGEQATKTGEKKPEQKTGTAPVDNWQKPGAIAPKEGEQTQSGPQLSSLQVGTIQAGSIQVGGITGLTNNGNTPLGTNGSPIGSNGLPVGMGTTSTVNPLGITPQNQGGMSSPLGQKPQPVTISGWSSGTGMGLPQNTGLQPQTPLGPQKPQQLMGGAQGICCPCMNGSGMTSPMGTMGVMGSMGAAGALGPMSTMLQKLQIDPNTMANGMAQFNTGTQQLGVGGEGQFGFDPNTMKTKADVFGKASDTFMQVAETSKLASTQMKTSAQKEDKAVTKKQEAVTKTQANVKKEGDAANKQNRLIATRIVNERKQTTGAKQPQVKPAEVKQETKTTEPKEQKIKMTADTKDIDSKTKGLTKGKTIIYKAKVSGIEAQQQKLNKLKNTKNKPITFTTKLKDTAKTALDKVKAAANKVGKLKPTIHVKAQDAASSILNKVNSLANSLSGKNPTVTATANVSGAISDLQRYIDKVEEARRKKFNGKHKGSGKNTSNPKDTSTDTGHGADGINNDIDADDYLLDVNSLADGQNNEIDDDLLDDLDDLSNINSYAHGKAGPKGNGGLTLTGERGYEIGWIPSENRAMILGAAGPQMTNLPADAVVWNHKQSKKIMSQKSVPIKTLARGNKRDEEEDLILSTQWNNGSTPPPSKDKKADTPKKTNNTKGGSGGNGGNNNGNGKNTTKKKGKQSDKSSEKTAGNKGRYEAVIFNITKQIEALQHKIKKNLDTINNVLEKTTSTISSISTAYKDLKKQTNDVVTRNKQLVSIYTDRLKALDKNKKTSGKGDTKSNIYRDIVQNYSKKQISWSQPTVKKSKKGKKSKSSKTKKAKIDLRQYVKQGANGAYVVNWRKLDDMAKKGKGKKNKAKAIGEATQKYIDENQKAKWEAEDAIREAKQQLEELSKKVYETFFGWKNELTEVYELTKKISGLEANKSTLSGIKGITEAIRKAAPVKGYRRGLKEGEYAKGKRGLGNNAMIMKRMQAENANTKRLITEGVKLVNLQKQQAKATAYGDTLKGDRKSIINSLNNLPKTIATAKSTESKAKGELKTAQNTLKSERNKAIANIKKGQTKKTQKYYGLSSKDKKKYKKAEDTKKRTDKKAKKYNTASQRVKAYKYKKAKAKQKSGKKLSKKEKSILNNKSYKKAYKANKKVSKKQYQSAKKTLKSKKYKNAAKKNKSAKKTINTYKGKVKKNYQKAADKKKKVKEAKADVTKKQEAKDKAANNVKTQEGKKDIYENALKQTDERIAAFNKAKDYYSMTMNKNGNFEMDIDYAKLEQDRRTGKITEAQYQAIKEQIEDIQTQSEDINKYQQDVEKYIEETYNTLAELQQQYAEIAGELRQSIEDLLNKEIDRLDKLNSAIDNGLKDILDKVKQNLELRRQQQDNEKTEKDIAQKQQQLAALRADTSGSNAKSIKQLEKEIADAQQQYQRTLEDQALQKLQDGVDEAAKQREQQINIAKAQLEYMKASGGIAAQVNKWLGDPDKYKNDIVKALKASKNYDTLTDVEKELANNEIDITWANLSQKNGLPAQIGELKKLITDPEFQSGMEAVRKWLLDLVDETTTEIGGKKNNNEDKISTKEKPKTNKSGSKGKGTKFGSIGNTNPGSAHKMKAKTSKVSIKKDKKGKNIKRKGGKDARKEYKELKKKYTSKKSAGGKKLTAEEQERLNALKKKGWKTTTKSATKTTTGTVSTKGDRITGYDEISNKFTTRTYDKDTGKIGNITETKTIKSLSKSDKDWVKANAKEVAQGLKDIINDTGVGKKISKPKDINSLIKWANLAGKTVKLANGITASFDKNGKLFYNYKTEGVRVWDAQTGKVNKKKYKWNKKKYKDTWRKSKNVGREFDQVNVARKKKKLTHYLTGGLNTTTGPAWLDGTPSKPELVLNAQDTKNFLALKDTLSRAVSNSGNITNDSNMTYDIDINVDHIANDYDVDKLVTKVKKEITQSAGYRNVTAVRRMR